MRKSWEVGMLGKQHLTYMMDYTRSCLTSRSICILRLYDILYTTFFQVINWVLLLKLSFLFFSFYTEKPF